MRIVILCSSVYSETACAIAASLAGSGHILVGAVSLSTANSATVLRKLGQWGVRNVVRYASSKLISRGIDGRAPKNNPYLQPFLSNGDEVFRSLHDVAAFYGFAIAICKDQNAQDSIARLKEWSPDLIVFSGGNILREQVLEVPRFGVLNVHLGLLPEIRGMSSPEWSLLNRVPVGITIHYMDAGIDTGPILRRCEFPGVAQCDSLGDLRNRLIAFGVEKVGEVIAALDHGTISAKPQSDLGRDRQFFVMHEWLQARAAKCLARSSAATVAQTMNG